MKKNFSWVCKNLLLPLIPFVAGWLVRSLNLGEFSFSNFSPGELAFSMSMLCLIMIINGKRLTDSDASEIILTLFLLGMVLFVCVFAINIFILTELYKNYDILIKGLNLEEIPLKKFLQEKQSYKTGIGQIWLITVIMSIVTAAAAIIFNYKYKIATHE